AGVHPRARGLRASHGSGGGDRGRSQQGAVGSTALRRGRVRFPGRGGGWIRALLPQLLHLPRQARHLPRGSVCAAGGARPRRRQAVAQLAGARRPRARLCAPRMGSARLERACDRLLSQPRRRRARRLDRHAHDRRTARAPGAWLSRGCAAMANPRALPCDAAAIRAAASVPACIARKTWVLVAAVLGSTLAFVDESVVNVALPTIEGELHATLGAMQWVINAYTL